MSNATATPESFAGIANEMADVAGAIVRRYFRTGISVDTKHDQSPVTEADRAVEAAIRDLIDHNHPDHGIFGEEHGTVRTDAEYVWVIDPIDGTKAFITGIPLFGTLIALLHRGRPVLGVIDQPVLKERWIGVAGGKTLLNGRPVETRPCEKLSDAYLFTTTPEMYQGPNVAAFERLKAAVQFARFGGDCYAFGLLASGFIDVITEASLKPYDYCALVPVVESAGGVMTDWQGKPLGLHSDGRVIAAGDRRIHEQALARLAG
ncbi:MAG: histidinol-phosphatase [Alphaproteobacteria bacterium]